MRSPSARLRLYLDAQQVEATHCYVGRRWQDVIGMYPPPERILDHRRKVSFITPVARPKKTKGAKGGGKAKQSEIVFDEGAGVSTENQKYDPTPITNEVRSNVDAWRNLAESVEKSELKKGDRVYLEGKIRTRQWMDKEGNKRTSVEIVANEMIMLGERRDNSHAHEAPPPVEDDSLSTPNEPDFPF